MDNEPRQYPSRRRLREQQREAQRARSQAPIQRVGDPVYPDPSFVADPYPQAIQQPPLPQPHGEQPGVDEAAQAPSADIEDKPSTGRGGKKKKKLGRRILAGLAGLFLLLVLAGAGLFLVSYWVMEVPSPDSVAQAETTKVFYADGKTQMGEFVKRNRSIIDTTKLPKHVGRAVVASEDRTFFNNSGVDVKGIARAFWNNVRGRPLQGASTLSQQYVENYYLGKNKSYWGKFKEAILALKINRSQSKAEILNNYLNTIYFGRGSYGIEAAAQAYFGKPAMQLTLSESALLAGIIPAPSAWDPQENPAKAKDRWQRVLRIMVDDGVITAAERDQQKFPQTVKYTKKSSDYVGTKGYLLQHIRRELITRAGYTDQQLDTLGLQITTTIQPEKQQLIEEAVAKLPDSKPANLRVGMVSVDTSTGAIVAEYGGPDYTKIQRSAAFQDVAQAGSTFKPFALLAGLEQGMSPTDRISGQSPMMIDGKPIRNIDHSYGMITLAEATKYSVNTAFVRLNQKVGVDTTREVAVAAGMPKKTLGIDSKAVVSVLGTASPHTLNIADAYGTFATGGIRRPAHIVSKVTDSAGDILYQADTKGTRVFDAGVIAQLNSVLTGVADGGTARDANIGRPMGAKTGSSQDNKSAQFVGFIPQMVTAVSLYQVAEDGSEQSITPFGGVREVTGSTWPARIWRWYMAKAVHDLPVENFDLEGDRQKRAGPKYRKPNYDVPSLPTQAPEVNFPHRVPRLPGPSSAPPSSPPEHPDHPDTGTDDGDRDSVDQPGGADQDQSPPERRRQNGDGG